jgi:threonine/homoserine/homoserine lactone efflux protein
LEGFASGLVVGLLVSVPVGPVAVYCVRRALARGVFQAGLSGLGAAAADAIFATIALFAAETFADELAEHARLLRLPGALLLAGFGLLLLRRAGRNDLRDDRGRGAVRAAAATFGFALANPLTILAFSAAIVVVQTILPSSPNRLALIAGVFAGSTTWWFLVSALAAGVGLRRIHLTVVDRVAGGLLVLGSGVSLAAAF